MKVTINRFRGPRRQATFVRFVGTNAELHIDNTGVSARYEFRLTDGLGDDEKMAPWRLELEDLEALRKIARDSGLKFKESVGDPRYLQKKTRKKKGPAPHPRQEKLFE